MAIISSLPRLQVVHHTKHARDLAVQLVKATPVDFPTHIAREPGDTVVDDDVEGRAIRSRIDFIGPVGAPPPALEVSSPGPGASGEGVQRRGKCQLPVSAREPSACNPRMLLHLHRPGPPLDRFVELVTFYADYQPTHSKERLLPDGAVEVIVDLTDEPKRMYDPSDHSRGVDFRRAWTSGMRRRWIVIEAAPASSMEVIRFRPGGAYPFLGFGVEGITD